ncbi:MAG: hypothetical protein OEM60_05075 [Gammaproteobacteria bacterium]|nr:hypothetical protein [Gammaproteobacteria bacterium]MDH3432177.1 hypothetical protein [Gammaproteobacteria bacterium]MDH3433205.1 hypothetical protein [Gammaproteobacteria bacterium]
MSAPSQRSSADSRVRQIANQQKQIQVYIRNILYELDRIDSGEAFDYWMVIEGTWGSTSYKKELEKSLKRLRRQLLKMKRQKKEVRLAVLRNNAKQVRKRNRLIMIKMLRKAAKERGGPTADEMDEMARHAEQTLRTFVAVLDENPSRANVKSVLRSLADLMLVGGSEASEKAAFGALGRAAEKRYRRGEERFRRNPTKANFRLMMRSLAEGQVLGAEFAESPPRPAGWVPAQPGTMHRVAPGETLKDISQIYYGSPAYWDIIYLDNIRVVGNNIRHLPKYAVLFIP